MIDWYNLLMNASWILGCAVALATLSFTSWEASASGKTFKDCLRQSKIQIALNIGGLLFTVGLAGTSQSIWQRVLWIILGLGFLVQILIEFFRRDNSE